MCAYWGNGAKMINIRLLALQMCSSQRSSSLTHSLRGAGVELVNGVKPDAPQHRIISRSDAHLFHASDLSSTHCSRAKMAFRGLLCVRWRASGR